MMDWRSITFLSACLLLVTGCAVDIYSDAGMRKLHRVSMRVDAFDFEMTSRGEMLWNGVARVSRMGGALYSVNAQEASGSDCPFGPFTKPNSYKLTLRTQKAGGNANDPDTYSFVASIESTDLQGDCKSLARNQSSASLQYVKLRPGQSLELSGNDGFRVSIRRR